MTQVDFSSRRVMVVGDLILDRYINGLVERLSPEAPVAVLLHESERSVTGGAANVVSNLAALGSRVKVIGVVGEDEGGRKLTEMLRSLPGLDGSGIIVDRSRPTTSKTRVMSARHQIVRIDSESRAMPEKLCEAALIRAVEESLDWAEVLILSDYAKGVCSDNIIRAVIELGAHRRKPIVVDPKRRNLEIYRGATILTPNRRELSDATGLACDSDEEAGRAARVAIERTGAAVLLTRSERGMSYFSAQGEPVHLPTAVREVFDVSGAGDTVVALVALGLAAALPITEVMRLANVCAGIVVGKIGTATVTKNELESALEDQAHHGDYPEKGALVSLEEAARRRFEWGRRGLRIGFTNGCFDLLHPGHVSLLKHAARECDRLIVGINTDASVRRLKGSTRPVQDENGRAFVLGGLAAVDLVLLFEEDTPADVIAKLKPDVLIKGADYAAEQVVGADIVRANGGRVLLVPTVAGQSTTAIIRRAAAEKR